VDQERSGPFLHQANVRGSGRSWFSDTSPATFLLFGHDFEVRLVLTRDETYHADVGYRLLDSGRRVLAPTLPSTLLPISHSMCLRERLLQLDSLPTEILAQVFMHIDLASMRAVRLVRSILSVLLQN
jgi:hypothetical protein